MRPSLLTQLVDPVHRRSLRLVDPTPGSGDVATGVLEATDGARYPVQNGIPRFVGSEDEAQRQTSAAFAYKWRKRETYDSPAARGLALEWYLEKYGFATLDQWVTTYGGHRRILDLGCGSGFSSSLWLGAAGWQGQSTWIGVDISDAIDVAQERLGHIPETHFVQADALRLPFADAAFDLVFSEGVLHHTPSTRQALLSAARVLEPGGSFHFYVYRRKAPVREFTDDYVRHLLQPMSDDEAWAAMRPLTRLGQLLAHLHATVEIPEDIPLLGIQAGRYDVQRLIYWNFAKLFWNPQLTFEENVHINFDWYRPRYAHRQTAAEVQSWCAEAGLEVDRFHEGDAGFTVRARRR
jgi:SAM-dependent methyltransferase